ncbi:hypothetical protein SRHO_G00194160 [Serrasalmus rhombeus]
MCHYKLTNQKPSLCASRAQTELKSFREEAEKRRLCAQIDFRTALKVLIWTHPVCLTSRTVADFNSGQCWVLLS